MKLSTTVMLTMLLVAAALPAIADDEKKDPFQKTFKAPKEAVEAMTAREPRAPKAGDAAPDVELVSLDGKTRVRLSSFKTNAPVVLVFGSYT